MGLDPFVMAQVARVEQDAEIIVLQGSEIGELATLDLDVVVASGEHPQVSQVLAAHDRVPAIVVTGDVLADPDPRVITLGRPVSSPQLRQAFDRVLDRPLRERLRRGLRVERDDGATAERLAFFARTVAAVLSIAWVVAGFDAVPGWMLWVLIAHTVIRAVVWRLSAPAVIVDVAIAVALTVTVMYTAGDTSVLAVALPTVVWVEAGWALGWARGFAVLASALAVVLAIGWQVYGQVLVTLDAAVGVLALAGLSILAGGMASRIAGDRDPGRRAHLQQFRSALYDLTERQAIVAVSFDLLTVAEDVLARLLRQAAPRAAVVLVRDPGGPLQVAAAHNLTRPPPTRLVWTPPTATLLPASSMLVGVTGSSGHADGDRVGERPPYMLAGDDGAPASVGPSADEVVATISHQLLDFLPEGDVVALPTVVDGELLGGILLVEPSSHLDRQDLDDLAVEAALSFDSVRLFNRLRAFTLDQERARIGRSLHDGVMQTLSHVAFQLDMAVQDGEVVAGPEQLADLRDNVRATLGEMRTVVNDLRSVRLDRGLRAALQAMAMTMAPAGGPMIVANCDEVEGLGPQVEEQLLRIAEEAVANAVRHAHATTVTVTLRLSGDRVVLQVADDGLGFADSARTGEHGGIGLTSIRQRAAAIGAGLDVDRGPGVVVTVTCAVRRRFTLDEQ